MKSLEQATGKPASRLIDQRIRDLGGWRGETLARMRALILEADPEMTEEWKWMGTSGLVAPRDCLHRGGVHEGREAHVRPGGQDPRPIAPLQFQLGRQHAKGDRHPRRGEGRRGRVQGAREGRGGPEWPAGEEGQARCEGQAVKVRKGEKVVLLSGGNPQIAKADGDAPVQAYIAAMPGWKRDLGKRLDALIVRNVPNVRKAVKWNSPFYGIEGQGWFLSFHVFTHYVKVTFFRGTSLRPVPPGASKDKDTRYIDIHEGDELDEAQMATWVKQAAALPGWVPGRPS